MKRKLGKRVPRLDPGKALQGFLPVRMPSEMDSSLSGSLTDLYWALHETMLDKKLWKLKRDKFPSS